MKKGLVQIYTGSGKGKTTAAVGQTIRALGHGHKVAFVYFHKSPSDRGYGEFKILKNLGVEVRGFAKKHPNFNEGVDGEKIREESLEGLKFVKEMLDKSYDVIVLDEIIVSIRDGFLKEDEVKELLNNKPLETELILTGRDAPESLIERADLVSRIEKVKHPFDEGIKSREGIEF